MLEQLFRSEVGRKLLLIGVLLILVGAGPTLLLKAVGCGIGTACHNLPTLIGELIQTLVFFEWISGMIFVLTIIGGVFLVAGTYSEISARRNQER